MTTDTSEKGLERLICTALTGHPCDPGTFDADIVAEAGAVWRVRPGGASPPVGCGWIGGSPEAYDREHCLDLVQLRAFLRATRPQVAEALDVDRDTPARRKFLARLQGEISKRGVVDVLRRGVRHGAHDVDFFYGTPSPANKAAVELNSLNRFSVTRQLRYSRDETSSSSTACRLPPSS
jgi:type I restriction enzyme R subunit